MMINILLWGLLLVGVLVALVPAFTKELTKVLATDREPFEHPEVPEGVTAYYSEKLFRWLRLFRFVGGARNPAGWTPGATELYVRRSYFTNFEALMVQNGHSTESGYEYANKMLASTVRHEAHHTTQAAKLGRRYGYAYVWDLVTSGFYKGSRMEAEARAHAAEKYGDS